MGLIFFGSLLTPVLFLIWIQDFSSPFYIASRVGQGGKTFKMIKLRSMRVNASQTGVDSTSDRDPRITPVGQFVRAFKLDELPELWNIFIGQMSFVGPRPNVPRETALYTEAERNLLSVKPGLTDFSSIVFSDEGEILKDQVDPNIAYHQLIRPWKSRLGLFYIENANFLTDLKLIYLTGIALVSRKTALRGLLKHLEELKAPKMLLQIAERKESLTPAPPPGATEIAMSTEPRSPESFQLLYKKEGVAR